MIFEWRDEGREGERETHGYATGRDPDLGEAGRQEQSRSCGRGWSPDQTHQQMILIRGDAFRRLTDTREK